MHTAVSILCRQRRRACSCPKNSSRGADGAMTGFAYPEMMVGRLRGPMQAGDTERAHDLFDAYLPLARYEQQAGASGWLCAST